jgi:hypothetical protein
MKTQKPTVTALQSIIPLKDIPDERKWSVGSELICNGRWFRVVETSCGEDSWFEVLSGGINVDRENDVTWLRVYSYTGPVGGFETLEEFGEFLKTLPPWPRTTWAFDLHAQRLIKCATAESFWRDDVLAPKEVFRRLMELVEKA